jgi:hypothetical protein
MYNKYSRLTEIHSQQGALSPRARRNPLEGAFDWATPVGRGGHRSVGRAPCVRLSERCVLFLFFASFRQDSPGFLGDPQGCPRQHVCGTTWKSCEGWMGPIPKGTHRRVCVSPRFAIRGHSVLQKCEVRMHFIPTEGV